jgi:hypothetical protein
MNARTSVKNEKQEVVATGKALQLVRYSFFHFKFVSVSHECVVFLGCTVVGIARNRGR